MKRVGVLSSALAMNQPTKTQYLFRIDRRSPDLHESTVIALPVKQQRGGLASDQLHEVIGSTWHHFGPFARNHVPLLCATDAAHADASRGALT